MRLNCSFLISLKETKDRLLFKSDFLMWSTFFINLWLRRYHHYPTCRVEIPHWGCKDNIDSSQGWLWHGIPLRPWRGLLSSSKSLVHELFQLPYSDQLVKKNMQRLVVLHFITSVLMILAIEILVSSGGVFSYFVGPLKIGLALYFFQHSVDWLLEYWIHHLGIDGVLRILVEEFPPQFAWSKPIWPIISSVGYEDFRLPLTLALIIFHPFVLLDTIHQLVHILKGSHGEGLPKVRLCKEPHLEGSDDYVLKIPINFIICAL